MVNIKGLGQKSQNYKRLKIKNFLSLLFHKKILIFLSSSTTSYLDGSKLEIIMPIKK